MKIFTLLLALCCFASVVAQENRVTISGKVTDASDGSALPGVSIVEKGTTSGGSSDLNGAFSLSVRPGATLVFSFVGYKPAEIVVGSQTQIDVALLQDVVQLGDIVVVGYGTQEKKDVTGALASLNNREFKDQPTTNVAANLQGKMAGVNITSTSGTPGAALNVSIRGATNPLYVVDGIPMISESNSSLSTSYDLDGNSVGSGQAVSSISDINPNDIESVEVLKDASAAAIYGSRAANGVVLITTKRGKSGKTQFNFNHYSGLQQPTRKIKFMNSQQMIDLVEEARANDLARYNADNSVFGAGFDPSVLTDPLHYSNTGVSTNWVDEVLRVAPISNYEVSANGGNEKTKFYTGGTYFDQSGIVINSAYRRLSARLNLDHQVNDKFSIGVNFSVAHSRNRRSFNDNTYTGIITNALGADPLMPPYDADGNYSDYTLYHTSWLSDNPMKSAKEIRAITTGNRLLASVFAEYKFTDALKFRTSWSTDYNSMGDDQFFSPLTTDASAVSGRALKSTFEQLTWLNENILTYNRKFQRSTLNAIAGYTMQVTRSQQTNIAGQGFPIGSGLENISSAALITAAGASGTSFGLLSYLSRVNYDLDGKYLFSATVRTDASSRFPRNSRYGVFPSASIGWRISQEAFFGTHKTLTDLKLRASYGLTGDQEIGNFQNVSYWSPARYQGVSGLKPRNLADPNLTWQTNRALNVGVDWELYGGRISGSIEYFKSNKTGLLSNDFIAGTTGFSTITRNKGEIENKGWEFTINSVNISKPGFRWNTSFNISFIKNQYKALSNDGLLLSAYTDGSPTHVMKVGQAVGTFWAIPYLGVDPQNGDALFRSRSGAVVNAETVQFDDATFAGKAIPDYYGGINNTFTVGKFDFLVATQFNVGNKIYNQIKATYVNMGWSNEGGLDQIYANNSVEVLNRWKKSGDVTNIPRASFINQNYSPYSTLFVENGSFLRIRTVTAGYTLKPAQSKWVSSLRIYATVQNLYVFTKYSGFDPEVSSTGGSDPRVAGFDYAAYPQARTYMIGFNLGF
ncbi:MAG: TonB-dependent receptor [Cyclobacteriaceae bacterium]